jgi:hypothetical protein
MANILKILGSEAVCNSTPSNFDGNKLVRLVNINATTAYLITLKNAEETPDTLGTFSILPRSEIFIEKTPTDTLESNNGTNILGVAVAYRN